MRFRRDAITAAELSVAVWAPYLIRDGTIGQPKVEAIVRRLYTEAL